MKNSLLLAALFSGIISFSGQASADAEMKPSFANKKSGQVAFKPADEAAEEAAANAEADPADVSQIEPAAGVEDQAPANEQNSLADDLKLPRKN